MLKYIAPVVAIIIAMASWVIYDKFVNELTVVNFDDRDICVSVSGRDDVILVGSNSSKRRLIVVPSEGELAWRYCDANGEPSSLGDLSSGLHISHHIAVVDGVAHYLPEA